jgi:hypothetical protein
VTLNVLVIGDGMWIADILDDEMVERIYRYVRKGYEVKNQEQGILILDKMTKFVDGVKPKGQMEYYKVCQIWL